MVYMALAYGMARADVWGRCRELGRSLVHEEMKEEEVDPNIMRAHFDTICFGVSCGVVQCFMLCYHRS